MSGAGHRRKGDRLEREIVARHRALGIHSERYPLSGTSRFRGSAHDLNLYLWGRDEVPAVAESKARRSGGGFKLERWLGEYDLLFLRRNHTPWRTWARLAEQIGGRSTNITASSQQRQVRDGRICRHNERRKVQI